MDNIKATQLRRISKHVLQISRALNEIVAARACFMRMVTIGIRKDFKAEVEVSASVIMIC